MRRKSRHVRRFSGVVLASHSVLPTALNLWLPFLGPFQCKSGKLQCTQLLNTHLLFTSMFTSVRHTAGFSQRRSSIKASSRVFKLRYLESVFQSESEYNSILLLIWAMFRVDPWRTPECSSCSTSNPCLKLKVS